MTHEMKPKGSLQIVHDQIEAARAAFKVGYRVDQPAYLRNPDATYLTYAIDVSYFDPIGFRENGGEHGSQIEVHGDEALRDRILGLLTSALTDKDIRRIAEDAYTVAMWAFRMKMKREQSVDEIVKTITKRLGGH